MRKDETMKESSRVKGRNDKGERDWLTEGKVIKKDRGVGWRKAEGGQDNKRIKWK